MNDWPVWIRSTLKNDPDFLDLLGAGEKSIYGAGALKGPPDKKPFVIIHMSAESPGPFPGTSTAVATVDVHDEPGTYSRIRLLLHRARNALCGMGQVQRAVTGAGIGNRGFCRWDGDSADLADEGFKTIVRQATFQLHGEDGAD